MADFWQEEELRALPPTARRLAETLIEYGIKRTYAKNHVMIPQDGDITEVLFIASGTASSHTVLRDGTEIWGFDFSAGDFVGHAALLGRRACRFEVRANQTLSGLSIPATRFTTIVEEQANISFHVVRDLSTRLNHMSERLIELTSLAAPARVCAELMRMARPIGVEEGKMIIRPGPVFTKLAKRVNSTRETVSRTVAELQRTGVISREPGALRIEDPAKITVKFD